MAEIFNGKDYWDERYQEEVGQMYDWLADFSVLRDFVQEVCTRESRILMLGCGNSLLSEEMYDAGFCNIDNIDISPVVIEQMEARNHERLDMRYFVMDATDLSQFDDRSFDVVLDKGTLDSLLCGDDAFINVARMTREVQRVLKPQGVYMVISYSGPKFR